MEDDATTQIAILSKNADGISFDVLKRELKKSGDKGLFSRQACDSLLIYFHDLAEQGVAAEIDYHFLGNLLSGEGGKMFVFSLLGIPTKLIRDEGVKKRGFSSFGRTDTGNN